MAIDPEGRASVLEDVCRLAAASAPALEELERTLTDGYALALQLESDRLHLQRELGQQAAALESSPAPDRVAEIADLARGVEQADARLQELRTALARLAEIARSLR